ncbi:MAG TPA: FMN-binding negative transcriptional regulator [Caulobacteraceae bacterium]|nr:FMN-binding negative transcriptional regulator [Caulobacteraceae bacterium]
MNWFNDYQATDVADLIAEYPLAWVTAIGGKAEHAALLPLVARLDDAGEVVRLIGHMMRRNPLFPTLSEDPRALILFTGPQGYVSPSDAGDRRWIPTWNFAQVRMEADITFEPDNTDSALACLVDAAETGQDDPWTIDEAGPRYRELAPLVIGFSARPTEVKAAFKLGQDERPAILKNIIANCRDEALARWMRRFNAARL